MGNKPASLLVVSLGKTLNGVLPSLCGRQVMGAKQSTCGGGTVKLKTYKEQVLSLAN